MSGPRRVAGLRLLVYDATCRGRRFLPGLSHVWALGARLYRVLARVDATHAATSWRDALSWLATTRSGSPIAEVQFWGHGKWGRLLVGPEVLDAAALGPSHPLHPLLKALRRRLAGPKALFWFRTCETFGAYEGQRFARRWTSFFGCPAAGHTHVIGVFQSGLHRLAPGATPDWSPAEGLAEGTPERPFRARGSRPWRPRTVSFLTGRVPVSW